MVVVSPPATIDDCGRAGRMAESEVVSEHIEEQVTEIKDIMDVDQNDAAMPQNEEHEDVFGDADDVHRRRAHVRALRGTRLEGTY